MFFCVHRNQNTEICTMSCHVACLHISDQLLNNICISKAYYIWLTFILIHLCRTRNRYPQLIIIIIIVIILSFKLFDFVYNDSNWCCSFICWTNFRFKQAKQYLFIVTETGWVAMLGFWLDVCHLHCAHRITLSFQFSPRHYSYFHMN